MTDKLEHCSQEESSHAFLALVDLYELLIKSLWGGAGAGPNKETDLSFLATSDELCMSILRLSRFQLALSELYELISCCGSLTSLPFPPTTMPPPRLLFVVLAGFLTVTITVVLLRRPFSSLTPFKPSFTYPDEFGPGRSLISWLVDEEAGYSAFVQQRHEALVRLGDFNP